MRIETTNIDDFLTVIRDAHSRGQSVFNNAVFVDTTSRKGDGVVSVVGVQASAVLDYADGSQALLQFGAITGNDVESGDGHTEGTDAANELREYLMSALNEISTNLRLLPGILST